MKTLLDKIEAQEQEKKKLEKEMSGVELISPIKTKYIVRGELKKSSEKGMLDMKETELKLEKVMLSKKA